VTLVEDTCPDHAELACYVHAQGPRQSFDVTTIGHPTPDGEEARGGATAAGEPFMLPSLRCPWRPSARWIQGGQVRSVTLDVSEPEKEEPARDRLGVVTIVTTCPACGGPLRCCAGGRAPTSPASLSDPPA
jgi:hypothetical protein